jgi:hypothetical protein
MEHKFEIVKVVCLRVQPLKLSPLRRGGTERMRPCLFGPFRVIQRDGEVAYDLEFTEGSQCHSVYHVPCLRRAWGSQVTTPIELPPLDERGRMLLTPEEIWVSGRGD